MPAMKTGNTPKLAIKPSAQLGTTCHRLQASANMMALYRTMHVRTYAARLIEDLSTMGAMRNPIASRTMILASFSLITWVIVRGLT